VCEAPGCLSERPHHVEVPHGERPCDGDGLERFAPEDGFVERKTGTPRNGVRCPWSLYHCGPIKSLLESLSNKHSRACFDVHTCRHGSLIATRGLDPRGCTA
jgi:hypothetical protein